MGWGARHRARTITPFRVELSRISELAAQLTSTYELDAYLARETTMDPATKAEVRKLILKLMSERAVTHG